MDGARTAMVGFAENMDALKRNFLVRGFFNGRGYFDLDDISPAAYRQGALTNGRREATRVWLHADELFEPDPGQLANERLTDEGKMRVDAAMAPFLKHVASGVVMVEGYAQQGSLDEQYLRSRARASLVRATAREVPPRSGVHRRDAAWRRFDRQPGAAAVGRRRAGCHPSQGRDYPVKQVTPGILRSGDGCALRNSFQR